MRSLQRIMIAVIDAVLLSAISSMAAFGAGAQTCRDAGQAIEIAKDFALHATRQDGRPSNWFNSYLPEATRADRQWKVSFEPGPGATGRSYIYIVDGTTCRVVHTFLE